MGPGAHGRVPGKTSKVHVPDVVGSGPDGLTDRGLGRRGGVETSGVGVEESWGRDLSLWFSPLGEPQVNHPDRRPGPLSAAAHTVK